MNCARDTRQGQERDRDLTGAALRVHDDRVRGQLEALRHIGTVLTNLAADQNEEPPAPAPVPSLSKDDQRALLGPIAVTCPRCWSQPRRHYCRSCDAFFTTCWCPPLALAEHAEHRVYLWTPDAILAIPK